MPTKAAIKEQARNVQYRKIQKKVVTASMVASALAVVYSFSCVRNAAHQKQKLVLVESVENNKSLNKQELDDIKSSFLGDSVVSLNHFLWDISKFFADAGTMLTAGLISTFAYDFVSKKLQEVYQEETVAGFVKYRTKLKAIFSDLKNRAVYYDLNSALLSSEMYHLKKEVHLKAFVSDLCQNVSEHKNNGSAKSLDYYKTLIKEIEERYKKEFNSLESLDEYISPVLSAQKRILSNNGKADLFNRDNQMRLDVEFLCNLFIQDFTDLLQFIAVCRHEQKSKISSLLDMSNQFLDHIEAMLNMSKAELDELSKVNQGLFTVIYEYEKALEQEILFLDTYGAC